MKNETEEINNLRIAQHKGTEFEKEDKQQQKYLLYHQKREDEEKMGPNNSSNSREVKYPANCSRAGARKKNKEPMLLTNADMQ